MKEKDFVKEILRCQKRFKIPLLYFARNDDIKWAACICNWYKNPGLLYNWKNVKSYEGRYKSLLFHELGHVVYKTYLWKRKSKREDIRSEYLAERFAVKMIKKYSSKQEYNRVVNSMIETLNDKKWCKQWPIHAVAFRRIYFK